MSTYGKKALAYWDYEGANAREEVARYNSTPHNLQEEILKKWFPVGMTCEKTSAGSERYYGSYVVSGYQKYGYGWRLNVTDEKNYTTTLHPGTVRPDEQWRRDKKLEKLGI
jgi:hypothetical protein